MSKGTHREGHFLTDSERKELRVQHGKERDGRICDRIKAVLLRDKGWTYKEISDALLIGEETARRHAEEYKESQKLKPENGGGFQRLNETDAQTLGAHMDETLYRDVNAIRDYVRRTFDVEYSRSGMTKLIRRLGFTYHEPCGVPAKAVAALQEEFIERYEKLKQELADGDQIFFMDGVHPSHAVRFCKGWIRKGERREIPTNASHKRTNLLGALNLEDMTLFHRRYETLNADATIDFLTALLESRPRGTLHVVLDQGRYQKCAAVNEWNAQNPRLTLHYLPAYSPNLNPIERCWKIMHEHTTNNRYYKTFKEFSEKITEFFTHIFPQNAKNWVDTLTDNFQVVGSNSPAS